MAGWKPIGPMGPPMLIYLEGNVASGKSTLLDWYKDCNEIKIIKEPIQTWTGFKNNKWADSKITNFLDKSYTENKTCVQYAFQNLGLWSRLKQLNDTVKSNKVRIVERSIFSALHVFSVVATQEHKMTNLEFDLLDYATEICSEGPLGQLVQPDLIIYLRTHPETCFERLKERNRPEEQNVSLGHLWNLHCAYDAWLGKNEYGIRNKNVPCPVLTLDGNVEREDLAQLILEINEEIIRGKTHYQIRKEMIFLTEKFEKAIETKKDALGEDEID